MSTTSTPHRQPRGVAIAGIDTTRASFEKPSAALHYGGYYTPPQSANESRRPSLACSSFSDMPYSATSTAASFSLPPTPVHSEMMYHSTHPVVEAQHTVLMPTLNTSLGVGHSPDDHEHLPLEVHKCDHSMAWSQSFAPQQHAYEMDIPSCYNGLPASYDESQSMWQDHTMMDSGFRQTTGLDSTLFSTSHSMMPAPVTATSVCGEPSWSIVGDDPSPIHSMQYGSSTANGYYPVPEIVNPSHVNPQDEYMVQQYTPYDSPEQSPHDISAGFTSSAATSFCSEYADQYSPRMDYDEVDDFVHIKADPTTSPTLNDSLLINSSAPRRRKNGVCKRQRRSQHIQSRINTFGVDVVVEGDNLGIGHDGQIVKCPRGQHKSHPCNATLEDGQFCTAKFVRSEHLKRHMSSHLAKDQRKFRCPVEKCTRQISRSDNYCDHFRTHLKPPAKNKRNVFCLWSTLSPLIARTYDEKTSKKILDNLLRWLENPESDKEYPEMQRVHGLYPPEVTPEPQRAIFRSPNQVYVKAKL